MLGRLLHLHAFLHPMSRQPLTNNGHANIEDLEDDAPVYELYDDATDVHLASVEEKKRIWWKNAFINMLFIASWYVTRQLRLAWSF